jgi:hypothetical protein
MRKLVISTLVFTLIITFSQELSAQNSKVDEYFRHLKTFSENIKTNKEDFKGKIKPEILENLSLKKLKELRIVELIDNLSDEEVIRIARLKAKAYEENPFKIQQLIYNYDNQISITPNNKNKENMIKLGIIDSHFMFRMEKILHNDVAKILEIPYILKVKVKTIEEVADVLEGQDNIPDLSMIKEIVEVNVEEVIKGENSIRKGEDLTFYFYKWWNNSGQQFSRDKTYLISLLARIDGEGNNILSLVFFSEGKNAIFPIEGKYIYDIENYFGFGKKADWNKFKNEFRDKFILK